jgi:hypothetical protein
MRLFGKMLTFGNTTNEPQRERMLPLPQVAPTGGTKQLTDVDSAWWFGPLKPIAPLAPESYRPRQWAYPPAANIIWQPKAGEVIPGVTFETLRLLADAYDMLRLVIETRKDQLAALTYTFRPKKQIGEKPSEYQKRMEEDPKLQAIGKFFEKPDGLHDFKKWLRMWLEDMLVIDAVALYLQKDKKGKIATIHPIDGATIGRIITEQGLTPPPDQPAYQQVIYGTPACDLTVDELAYSMRNERTCRRYGFSRVEQVLLTINLGLRRKDWQMQYYTSGSTPDAFVFLPADMSIDQVEAAQNWFDSIMSGQSNERRKVRFLPGYGTGDQAKPNIIFPKEVLLKDPIDEWLAQIVCYAFGVSPQAFMKMMNRATATSATEQGEEEGLAPDKEEVLSVINGLLDRMGFGDDYECITESRKEPDALKQSTIDMAYLGKVKKINEVRGDLGLDPYDHEYADLLGVFTATGTFVPLGEQPPQPPGMGGEGGFSANEEETPPAEKVLKERIVKLIRGNGHDDTATIKTIRKLVDKDYDENEPVGVVFDSKNGIGADDKYGDPTFIREMMPDEYLNIVLPVIGRKDTSEGIEQSIRSGQSVAPPVIEAQWNDDKASWQVTGHDGRHRMLALRNIDQDMNVPVRVYVNE